MAKDTSMRAFKCPSCGAPLEPESGTLTMKCPYCGGTVIIPQSMRTPAPSSSSGPSFGEVFNFGLSGIDLNKVVGNAMRLPEAIELAQAGKLDEAADIYSQITGMEHADAMTAMKAMAKGHAVALTPGLPGTDWRAMQSAFSSGPALESSAQSTFSGETFTPPASKSRGGLSCAVVGAIVACVAIAIAAFAFLPGMFGAYSVFSPLTSIGFANKAMSFGEEGIGQGMLQDARTIGLDGRGNIVVGSYSDGRVQIFDPGGKFVSMFSLGPKFYLQALAVDRAGKIYVVNGGAITIFDEQGRQVGQIGDDDHDYGDVTIGGDGKLYALSDDETIVRFKADGTIDLEIPNSISNITGDSDIDTHLAVDGLGNMYILGNFTYTVFKYSRQGKFVNQFAGEAKTGSNSDPSKLEGPLTLAVDGYGRVFVADIFEVKVYDPTGTYLGSIGENDGAVFGLAFDAQNNLYTVSKAKVVKFTVKKPQGD
jgi:predicted RNA-binding Zn-ribbon protein involved in translation (DUF1610 family)